MVCLHPRPHPESELSGLQSCRRTGRPTHPAHNRSGEVVHPAIDDFFRELSPLLARPLFGFELEDHWRAGPSGFLAVMVGLRIPPRLRRIQLPCCALLCISDRSGRIIRQETLPAGTDLRDRLQMAHENYARQGWCCDRHKAGNSLGPTAYGFVLYGLDGDYYVLCDGDDSAVLHSWSHETSQDQSGSPTFVWRIVM
jgi:hypothetical protein